LSTLDELRVQTSQGSVPISNFVVRKAKPSVGILNRIDGARTVVVQANVAAGAQVAAVQQEVTQAVTDMNLGSGIRWKLAGSNEDSAEASAFLSKAFGAAIFLIFLVLLAQFNKFTSVWLVLSCV
ncbi:MAG: efflux RND transporter permease subunit, partial [Mesorhizobium sp.]